MNSFFFIAEMQLTLSKGCIIILDNLQLLDISSPRLDKSSLTRSAWILYGKTFKDTREISSDKPWRILRRFIALFC